MRNQHCFSKFSDTSFGVTGRCGTEDSRNDWRQWSRPGG